MCCKKCIQYQLEKLRKGTKIRLFTCGEPIDLTFHCLKKGCIEGNICKSPIYVDVDQIIGFIILLEDEWIKIAPEQSYPLPLTPPEVCRVEFDAKTDSGKSSVIILAYEGYVLRSDSNISNIPTTEIWDLNASYPADHMFLMNKGNATIYIRNLVTK